MLTGLTPQQRALMLLVQRSIDRTGVCPTMEELRAAVGLASRSGVYRRIGELIERGYLSKPLRYSARALTVLRRVPDEGDACTAYRSALERIAAGADARPIARKVLEDWP